LNSLIQQEIYDKLINEYEVLIKINDNNLINKFDILMTTLTIDIPYNEELFKPIREYINSFSKNIHKILTDENNFIYFNIYNLHKPEKKNSFHNRFHMI